MSIQVSLGVAVLELAFDHVGLTAQRIAWGRPAAWLQIVSERTLARQFQFETMGRILSEGPSAP